MSNKVPQLRFNGYSDAWEERKLGTIYNFGKGKGLPLDSFIYSSNNPAIAYGHLYTKYSEVISEVFWSSNDNGVLSKDNDLLFPGSSTVPNGTAQANAITLNNVKLGGDIIIGRPKEGVGVLSTFMSYQVNSQRQKLFPITVGTTITHMYGKDISKLNFFITDYSEQEKIASFFKQLDDTIALHQRKLDLLKEQKKGYLQKMFPKNGAKVPKLRFAGFADDWEERKLGDEVKINGRIGFRGYTQADIVTKETGVLAYSPTNIVNNRLYRKQSDTYITKQKYRESPEIMVKNSDILFVKTGSTLGKSALVQGINYHATVNPQIVIIRSNELDEYFLSVILTSYNILKRINTIKIGGAIPTMTETELKKFPIQVPKSTEQKKIGSFFKQLDNTIDLHQRKLDFLKEQKKGLLQKMFV